MNAGNLQEITQIMPTEFGINRSNFPPNLLKEANSTLDSQVYTYYSRFTENEISQQSADQLLRSRFNSVEFDGFRTNTEVHNPEMEQGASS